MNSHNVVNTPQSPSITSAYDFSSPRLERTASSKRPYLFQDSLQDEKDNDKDKQQVPAMPNSAARQQATAAKINPNWLHYGSAALLGAIILGNLLRWAILDWTDPYRCEAFLTTGSWSDPGKWTNWQPEGCINSPPDAKLLSKCLLPTTNNNVNPQTATIQFIGDSTVRQFYFAASQVMNPALPGTPEDAGGEKHTDREVVVPGKNGGHVKFSFWWDPFLNSTKTLDYLSTPSSRPTSLLIMGSGLWYLRHPSSGGLSAWTTMIDETFNSIQSTQPKMFSHVLPPPSLQPGRPGIADSIIFLPVTVPVDALLSKDRAATISHNDVEAMNSGLLARLLNTQTSGLTPSIYTTAPIIIPTVLSQMTVPTETEDGLHYSLKIVKKQTEVLLGYRCNDAASTMSGVCCRRDKKLTFIQILVLLFVCGWGPTSIFLRSKASGFAARNNKYLAPAKAAMPITVFGTAIFYLFLADRTSVFLKEQKQYSAWTFTTLILIALAAGLATTVKGDKDMGFLNREQTDEWKGWMQIAILIYHFFGASKISGIYNCIRVLVASYLFMTGYGHFTYYFKKNEFGFQRIAMVMVRLNLLSIVLPYTMNTDYAFYYFAPLVSWWYTIIFVTMLIGHKYNDKPAFLIPKMILSAVSVAMFMKQGWIMENIFSILRVLFGIEWSAKEWSFRVSLDLYIVYGGMFCSYAYIKIKEYRLPDQPWFVAARNLFIGLSSIGFVWYLWFELSLPNKFIYNDYHPYVSFIPIFAFIILRNASGVLRSASSKIFIFIGQCSLETFILQFHGWMASDTRGILMIIPGTQWRPLNLILSTIVFIWLSYKVSNATGEITDWAVGLPKKKPASLPVPVTTPAPVPSVLATARDAIEDDGTKEAVPESIALMNRDEPNSGLSVDDEGLLDITIGTRGNNAQGILNRLSNHPYLAKFSETAKKNPAVKLGLSLVVLWILNLLY